MENIKILYFGMIAEKTGKDSEEIQVNEEMNLVSLRKKLEKQYSDLNSLNYRFALDAELVVEEDVNIQYYNEVALLPAFAGG